jgi:beta-glucosidase
LYTLIASPDADIPKGVKKVIDELQTRTGAKVLVLGLLPRQYNNMEHNGNQVRGINQLIAKFDNGNTIRYLDMWSHFVGSTIDTVNTSLYNTDKLHPNAEGYKVWAQAMDPLLKQMFG